MQGVKTEFSLAKGFFGRHEPYLRSFLTISVAHDFQGRLGIAMAKFHAVVLTIAPNVQTQPNGQGVDNRHANTVQTTRNFIAIAVELTPRVQLGHDHFSSGHPFFRVHIHRNTATIVADTDRTIRVQAYVNPVAMPRQGFVNGIVHDLINHVVQTTAVIRVTDVHTGTLSNCIQALEDFNTISTITIGLCLI